MPNWCYASYVAEGSKEEISELYNKIESQTLHEEPEDPFKFGKMWLGNLIELLGEKSEDIYCRGEILEWERENDMMLRYQTMTAWGEMEAVRKFIQQKYPTLTIYYQAEESGCNYYETNDALGKYFPERYVVNPSDGCEQIEYMEGEEQDFFDDIATLTGKTVTSIAEVENAVHEYNASHEDWIELKIFKVQV